MDSKAISQEIKALEAELSSLRARADEDSSTFSNLEKQVLELRENLAQTQKSLSDQQERLAEKQRELVEAQQLEALDDYKTKLAAYQDVAGRVARAAKEFLSELDAYDTETQDLVQLLEDMRRAFGYDDRVAEVERALAHEPEDLHGWWEALVAATRWRMNGEAEVTLGEAAGEGLPEHLQELAQERRRARIKQYFGRD